MKHAKTDWWIVSVSTALTAFGSALTWTGLPFFVAKGTGDSSHMLSLFIAETIASVLMILCSGIVSIRWPARDIAVATELACGAVLLTLYFNYDPAQPWQVYATGVLMASIAALSAVPLKMLSAGLRSEAALEMWWARRGMVVVVAKIAGTAAGPVLFEWLGAQALIFDFATFLLAGVGFMLVSREAGRAESPSSGESLRELASGIVGILSHERGRALLALQFASGALGMPLTAAAVSILHVRSSGDPYAISAYWVLGFVAAFLTNAFLGTGWLDRLHRSRIYFGAMFLVAAGIILLGASVSWVALIGAQVVLTMGRVSSETYLFGLAYRLDASSTRPLTLACTDAVAQAGVVTGMLGVMAGQAGASQSWIWLYGAAALGICLSVWQKAFAESSPQPVQAH